jgi:hypothetical protein
MENSHVYGLGFMSCFGRWWVCPLLIQFVSPLITPTHTYIIFKTDIREKNVCITKTHTHKALFWRWRVWLAASQF